MGMAAAGLETDVRAIRDEQKTSPSNAGPVLRKLIPFHFLATCLAKIIF